MSDTDRRRRLHDLDVTVWVGKKGIDAVSDELTSQLDDREFVKVKFHRSAIGRGTTDDVAADLADAVDATLVRTRGNTAIYET
ncbi:MAG: YhbY family RNA-binding protein [Haloarculaceae archaeon]